MSLSGPAPLGCVRIPKFETALEGVRVVSQPRLPRQASKLRGIAASQHDVIGLQCLDEMHDDVGNLPPPLFLSEAFEAGDPHTILKRLALAVRQMPKLRRLQDAVDDHRRAQTRSQPKKKHPAALVTAESLHHRVIDHLRRATERSS